MTGMFHSKINGGDEFIRFEPTDLSLYDKSDIEHVGWFWLAREAGQPVWLNPYYNQNNGFLMISFVIPLYFADQFIGVVGMDYDYSLLVERIHKIKIFENGFAHLMINEDVIDSGCEFPNHDHEESKNYLCANETLANGMDLVLYANYKDITQIRYKIALKISLSTIILMAVFICIVIFVVKKSVKPLRDLTEASIKLANGDYDVKIAHGKTYEIQQLSTAFENMLLKLREHRDKQHLLAYRDSLTGLRNTTSYKDWLISFNDKIKNEEISFGVMVLDINYLKETNDTYGHNVGNDLIFAASRIISGTFKRSPVFRIGGDEFLVILQNLDLKEREALFAKFDEDCEAMSLEAGTAQLRISIAKGFSMFDPSIDTKFSDVFNRADSEMYKNKKSMKNV